MGEEGGAPRKGRERTSPRKRVPKRGTPKNVLGGELKELEGRKKEEGI